MSAPPVTLDELRSLDLFDALDDQQLNEWLAVAQAFDAQPDTVVAEQGEEPPGLLLLLSGDVRTQIVQNGRVEPVDTHHAPTWMGAISVLTGGLMGVRLRALTACRMALVEPEDFQRLVFTQPAVHQRVMAQVAPVMSRITSVEQNRERLAALGTMAAGLAHELNNPAAAARRAASQMNEALQTLGSTVERFVNSGIEREQAAALVSLQQAAVAGAEQRTALDALDAADAEDDLRDRMEELGIGAAWELAEPLARAGVDQSWLAQVAANAGMATEDALRWVAATITARSLSSELCESTNRMSSLVGAVKAYTYMDRGDLVEIDVHEGLETTLTVLGHKLKQTSIAVRRDYDRTLPLLTVRGTELNQVWTNLLDNAIDALGERGTITIATRRDGDCARVDIADDGPGIPADLRDRVFDSFFTTKDVGKGTGLGLATVRRIVVDRHEGSVTVDSRPGETTFHVWLPLPSSAVRRG